ncbi:multiheme c-type cytochrome [Bacteroidota bacterium]
MLSKVPVTVILVLTVSFLGFSLYSVNYLTGSKYVGVKTCGMCHKKENVGQQLKIWQDSQHSKAYKTLQTEKADKIAKEKGFTTKAVDTPECLKCHTSGYNVDASQLGKKFSVEDGVQCETCHGPGSEYKSKKVMKDKNLAVEKGLLLYENPEKLCVSCHNEESPSFTGFNFEERWAKIMHRKPE